MSIKNKDLPAAQTSLPAKEFNAHIEFINLATYVKPDIKEVSGQKWVLNGAKNSFYTDIIDCYDRSPTHRTIVNSFAKFMYGKGLYSKQMASKAMQFAIIKTIISKKDLKSICLDFKLFGEASVECIYKSGDLKKIKHVAKHWIAPAKMTPDGDIENYFFCRNFSNTVKYKPVEIPAYGFKEVKNGSCIYIISDYQVGKTYFANPDYLPAMPSATLEGEMGIYCVSHIQNGLSVGHFINMNNGKPEDEEVAEKQRTNIREKLTGPANAGRFVINYNENKDTAITVDSLEVSDAHKQYEFLSSEAERKILIGHGVTNPKIFGIYTAGSGGFGNNAEELETSFDELMDNVIQPLQESVLDGLTEILRDAGFTIDLDFIPLRQPSEKKNADGTIKLAAVEEKEDGSETDDAIADELIKYGETVDLSEWELIDDVTQKGEPDVLEISLNLATAYAPSNFPERDSEQDTSLFKIRYEYKGSKDPERLFCKKMVSAGLVYRKEDIDAAARKAVNPGLGPEGSNFYDIWLYKGGANCKHFWQRKIYLKSDNGVISAAKAQEILNGLEPGERGAAKPVKNKYEVAKIPYDLPHHGYLN